MLLFGKKICVQVNTEENVSTFRDVFRILLDNFDGGPFMKYVSKNVPKN